MSGDVVVRSLSNADGEVWALEIVRADPTANFSKQLLESADRRFFQVQDDLITIKGLDGGVQYRITGESPVGLWVEAERVR